MKSNYHTEGEPSQTDAVHAAGTRRSGRSNIRPPKHADNTPPCVLPRTIGLAPTALPEHRPDPVPATGQQRERRTPAAWLLVVHLALLTSCAPKPERAEQTAAPPVAWSWTGYPATNQIRLAVLSCKVLPKSSLTLVSPLAGLLRVQLAVAQTNLAAGVVWAEFEPRMLASEAEALQETKQRLDQREQALREFELPRQRLKITRELWEAERQTALLSWLRTNQDLATLTGLGLKSPDLRPEGLPLLQEEAALLKRSLATLSETNLTLLGIDLEMQRAEWQRRRVDFERKRDLAQLKMPLAGQLTMSLPMAEGVSEYPVNTGQELAVARDLSLIQLRMVLVDSGWAALPATALSVSIRLPAGEELTAGFTAKRIERVQTREEAVVYFLVPLEQAAQAARLVGMDVPAELRLTLERPVRVVPKLALLLHQTSAFQSRNWADGVARLWPGARVAAEGQTELAIELTEAP